MSESLFAAGADRREELFAKHLTTGERMVHRLRDWSTGQTIWGWSVHTEDGASMGKTHTRRDFEPMTGDETETRMRDELVSTAAAQLTDISDTRAVAFVWVAEVAEVHTEPPGPDPGEPPLKTAHLDHASVVWSDGTEPA